MTTKEKVRAKVKQLLNDTQHLLLQELEDLLDSEIIDYEQEEDNWALPKDIMQAFAKEIDFQYSKCHKTKKDEIRIYTLYRQIRYDRLK